MYQGTYTHENQQILALQGHCKVLEQQILKLTTECETVKSMFQQLASAVHLPQTDPLKLEDNSLAPFLTTTDTKISRPDRKTHPHIRFWNQDDFFEWLDKAPEADLTGWGKVAYLEDEGGNTLPESTVKGARKVVHSGYCELTNRGLAPKSWGKLCMTGRQLFHTIVENAYPFFKFANDGWKLDHLAGTSYPAWH
ncbi:hypothetical protein BDR07DRAFT_1379301 [Suillus spraguei]|nr:hypothetical protein BDR07DRAFT_1379301 [Suillus spraguei]